MDTITWVIRMGTNPEEVVDKNLKLFGKSNLFICGSSVFPSAGHANPTLTLTQLSLRLASFLTKILKQMLSK